MLLFLHCGLLLVDSDMKRKFLSSDIGQSSAQRLLAEGSQQRVAGQLQNRSGAVGFESNFPSVKSPSEGASCRKLKLSRRRTTNVAGPGDKPLTASSEKCVNSRPSFTPQPAHAIANRVSACSSPTSVNTTSPVKSLRSPRSVCSNADSYIEVPRIPPTSSTVGCQQTSSSLPVQLVSPVHHQPSNRQSWPSASGQTPRTITGRQASSKHAATGSVNSDAILLLNHSQPCIALRQPKGVNCQKSAVISSPAVYYGVKSQQNDAASSSGKDSKGASCITAGVHHKTAAADRAKSGAAVKDVLQLLQPNSGVMKKKKPTAQTPQRVESTPVELCHPKKPRDVTSTDNKAGRFIQTFTPASTTSPDCAAEAGDLNSKKKMMHMPQRVKSSARKSRDVSRVNKPATSTPHSTVSCHHSAAVPGLGEDMEIDDTVSEVVQTCLSLSTDVL